MLAAGRRSSMYPAPLANVSLPTRMDAPRSATPHVKSLIGAVSCLPVNRRSLPIPYFTMCSSWCSSMKGRSVHPCHSQCIHICCVRQPDATKKSFRGCGHNGLRRRAIIYCGGVGGCLGYIGEGAAAAGGGVSRTQRGVHHRSCPEEVRRLTQGEQGGEAQA